MADIMKLLIAVLDDFNEYNVAQLWMSFTTQKIVCINIETSVFYHLNNKSYLWQIMGPNELSSIIQIELISFLTKNKETNSDVRLDKVLNHCIKVNKFNTIVQQVSKMNGFYDREKTDKFLVKLDSDPEVINFKNGLYNLKTKEFRIKIILLSA